MEFSDNEDVNYIHGGTDTHVATNKMRGTGRKSMVTDRKPKARTHGGNTSSASSSKFTSNATQENATGRVSGKTQSEIQRDETIDENVSRGNVDEQSISDQDNNANATNGKESYRANHYDALPHILAGIALAVALYTLYTQFFSTPPLQSDCSHFLQVEKLMEEFSKRLDRVESGMQDSIASIKGFEESFKELKKAVANKDDIANLVQKRDFEDRVRKIEQNVLDQVSANVEEVNNLQNKFLKLEDEISMQSKGISGIKNEQKELKTNVMTLDDKLGKQSQYVEKKTAEVEKEMSQNKEAVHVLNVSYENLENNLKYLTENVTGISIETLVLDKRTEDIKENIFDKVSLSVVIMMDTVLLVVVIIYLAAKRDNNRHFNRNVDIEEQKINGGAKNSPAPYSTAGRILSQVRAHPRLENKLCVISFYDETHPLHMRMTQSVTQQLTIQPVEFIIRRHDDILNIPPVVLFFLFVDFNERNVILEDPTLGLGDLRLTTVQAVQKMGGKMVIFYVRDQKSKQLDSTKLYNEDLVSVTRQRELSDLNQRSCFISAYDQLTDFQKTHLKRIVGNELTGR